MGIIATNKETQRREVILLKITQPGDGGVRYEPSTTWYLQSDSPASRGSYPGVLLTLPS